MDTIIRKKLEEFERNTLSPNATLSESTRGRRGKEKECDIRPAFHRDRDRIIHSKSFRRLKHKTQVFLAPQGDHYRTRLTHTIEVSQIARTIARSLFLNESLVEAIALGHDLGHTPFGHAGEHALREVHPYGFEHSAQSLRVVDLIERDGKGLNLTHEVRDGIARHSKGMGEFFLEDGSLSPRTPEGNVVRLSDIIAYVNHDIDDALRAGVIREKDIPKRLSKALGKGSSARINTMVRDVIQQSAKTDGAQIQMSPAILKAMMELRKFLYDNVYQHEMLKSDFDKSLKIVSELYRKFSVDEQALLKETGRKKLRFSLRREVVDFIAGMTDRYALELFGGHFLPKPWGKEII